MCIFETILGVAIIIGAVLLEIAWLGICFGSVILGLVLLVFAPHILLAPLSIGIASGSAVIAGCNDR